MNIDVSGTIQMIMPIETDMYLNKSQRIIIVNATTTNRNVQVQPTVVVLMKTDPSIVIPFKTGDPITIRGTYLPPSSPNQLATMSNAHAPTGFVRYSGRVYR